MLYNNNIMNALTQLHYDPKWLEYGFVDQQFVDKQSRQYETTNDKNTEHYRYSAFRRLLAAISDFDDVTLGRYIELANLDKDQEMAQAALGLLIKCDRLTDEQLERLKVHRAFATTHLQNIIEETQLLRILESKSITDRLFERCMSLGKSVVQRKLLCKPEISQQQLEFIKDQGINRAIRNIAKNKLRRQ